MRGATPHDALQYGMADLLSDAIHGVGEPHELQRYAISEYDPFGEPSPWGLQEYAISEDEAFEPFGEADDGTWLTGLRELLPEELARGVRAYINRTDAWPPSLPEFRALCLGILEAYLISKLQCTRLRKARATIRSFKQ